MKRQAPIVLLLILLLCGCGGSSNSIGAGVDSDAVAPLQDSSVPTDSVVPDDVVLKDLPKDPGDVARQDQVAEELPVSTYSCSNPDPAWLLCDDFEAMDKGFDAWFTQSGWTEALGRDDRGRLDVSTESYRGKYALVMPAKQSAGYRGGDLLWRSCEGENKPGCKTLKGYKRLYLRTFIRLAADHKKVHHFLAIGGGPIDDYWVVYGNAGCRPNGKRWMGTTVDFKNNSHETFFYTYYPDMTCDPGSSCANYSDPAAICQECASKDMPCNNGQECCWGNHFAPSTPVPLPLNTWFCFEMTMRPNDVGKKDGEMAYWIDGKLAHEVKGMHWRNEEKLQLNMVRLQHYLTTSDANGHSNRIWFDNVVISTERVGCE